jgi:CheY-like chemotaxis protein
MRGSSCDHVVMVVDDDPDIRDSLADLLLDEGYRVVTAQDGSEALDKLRTLRPCAILLDWMMPVMNGAQFQAAKHEDASLASIPVVIISADRNVAENAKAVGLEYLAKPVRIEQVLNALERHC